VTHRREHCAPAPRRRATASGTAVACCKVRVQDSFFGYSVEAPRDCVKWHPRECPSRPMVQGINDGRSLV